MSWSQAHNNTMDCVLTPEVRVSWSQPRCWHGETVTISIRSLYVKDGGIVDLEIFPDGNVVAVDSVLGLVLNANTLDHPYVVDWKTKVVPATATLFRVVATLRVPLIVSEASDPLGVDLIKPVFSA